MKAPQASYPVSLELLSKKQLPSRPDDSPAFPVFDQSSSTSHGHDTLARAEKAPELCVSALQKSADTLPLSRGRDVEGPTHRSRRRLRLTGYRLLSIAALASFGIAKGVASFQGKMLVSNTVDVVFGGGITAAFLIVGYLFEDQTVVWPWLFKTDYTKTIMRFLSIVPIIGLAAVIYIPLAVLAAALFFAFPTAVVLCQKLYIGDSDGHGSDWLDVALTAALAPLTIFDVVACCLVLFGQSSSCTNEQARSSKCRNKSLDGQRIHIAILIICLAILVFDFLRYWLIRRRKGARAGWIR